MMASFPDSWPGISPATLLLLRTTRLPTYCTLGSIPIRELTIGVSTHGDFEDATSWLGGMIRNIKREHLIKWIPMVFTMMNTTYAAVDSLFENVAPGGRNELGSQINQDWAPNPCIYYSNKDKDDVVSFPLAMAIGDGQTFTLVI